MLPGVFRTPCAHVKETNVKRLHRALYGAKEKFTYRKGVLRTREGEVSCCKFCYLMAHQKEEIVYEEEDLAVIRPLRPASALGHFLIVPKIHLADFKCFTSVHLDLVKRMRVVAEQILRRHTNEMTGDFSYAFHAPPFNSVGHVHMHAIAVPPNKLFGNCLNAVKYYTGTWWCRSYQQVVQHLEERFERQTLPDSVDEEHEERIKNQTRDNMTTRASVDELSYPSQVVF